MIEKTPSTIRLIVTDICNRNCKLCSNKQHFHKAIEINENDLFEEIYEKQYKEIVITGGEPILFSKNLRDLFIRSYVGWYKSNPPEDNFLLNVKKYLYVSEPNEFKKLENIQLLQYLNGITLTIHDNKALEEFKSLTVHLNVFRKNFKSDISYRLNLFENFDISDIPYTDFWKVKKIVWKEDCKIPSNEKLYKLKDLWK